MKESEMKIQERRKLRPIVISMGGKRKKYIEDMFMNDPFMREHFEKPYFIPGVSQRELRNSFTFIQHAGKSGIIPQAEWEILSSPEAEQSYNNDPRSFFSLVKHVPIDPDRQGDDYDKSRSYSKELWKKAKGINRGRSVLACTFAHLRAMKVLVDGDENGETYDFILEDNVRAVLSAFGEPNQFGSKCEAAWRMHETIQASKELEEMSGKTCHLRYYGWLGSLANLEFVLKTHCPRTRFARDNHDSIAHSPTVFTFPVTSDFQYNLHEKEDNNEDSDRSKAGGTAIWGAYAYWISKVGYEALISSLQKDVGAMLWKGKVIDVQEFNSDIHTMIYTF